MEEDNHVIYSYVQDPSDGQQVVYEEDQLQVVQDQVLFSYTHTCIFPKKSTSTSFRETTTGLISQKNS